MAQLFESSSAELQQMMTKSNVDVSTVADRLFEKKVINQSTFEDVKSRKSNEEKIGALSDAVTQLGRTAYDSCSEIIKNLTVEVQEPPLAERVEATSVPSSDTAATPSLSQLLGNMNLHFVNTIELEPEYLCPITSEILLDVYQTNCCGNRISQTAFLHLSNSNAPCPNCRAPSFTADPDIPFKKKLRNKRVRCEYGDHGCKWEGCLDQLVEHKEKDQDYHRTLRKIRSIAPQEFVLIGYNDFRKSQKTWCSPSFYTGHSGYRMRFRIDAERDDHLGLYVYLMKGVYDDILPFPFRGTVTVQLIKQDQEYQCSVEFDESVDIKHTTRVLDGDHQKHGYGYSKFYPLKKLVEFLEDDSLRFRVTVKTNTKKDAFPEMKIIAEKEIKIKKVHKFEWKECGFSLHIPDDVNALDENIETITIAVSLKGQCCFPESHELVSAVYWIFPSLKFSGPVTIGIEHCANLSIKDSELCFVSAHCTRGEVSYNFMQVGGGTFAEDNKFGYLSTTHFSGFGIVQYILSGCNGLFMPWKWSNYRATLYHEDVMRYYGYEPPFTSHLYWFLVTPCLEASQQAVVKKCTKDVFLDYTYHDNHKAPELVNSLDFTFEKEEIKVGCPQLLDDELKVTPLKCPKIAWRNVFLHGYDGFRFTITYPCKPPVLEVELQIEGMAASNSSMRVPIVECFEAVKDTSMQAPCQVSMQSPCQVSMQSPCQVSMQSPCQVSMQSPCKVETKELNFSQEVQSRDTPSLLAKPCINTAQPSTASSPSEMGLNFSHQEKSHDAPSEFVVPYTNIARGQSNTSSEMITSTGYKMDSKPHGIALVISNTKFDENSKLCGRETAEVDENKVKQMFSTLLYDVILLKNLTGDEILKAFHFVLGKDTLDTLTQDKREFWYRQGYNGKTIAKDNDSFICCLMSHGVKDAICGVDGSRFYVDLSSFADLLGPCPFLTGKPKMAFIQCCQDGNKGTDKEAGHSCDHDDFCIFYSAVWGRRSFRRSYPDPVEHMEKGGALYIHALHEAITKEKIKSLHTLMNRVTYLLRQHKSDGHDGHDQCALKIDTLQDDVHFL